jgi:hypothetical protein
MIVIKLEIEISCSGPVENHLDIYTDEIKVVRTLSSLIERMKSITM